MTSEGADRTAHAGRRTRIRAIDATRGFAMLFVFFNHFAEVYFREQGMSAEAAYLVTMVASPTFMLVSGVLLGYFFTARRRDWSTIRLNYLRRGIFLLTVGHAVIALAHLPLAGGIEADLRWLFITDAIGVAIILGPFLVERWGPKVRLAAGVMALATTWYVVMFLPPYEGWAQMVLELLFGPSRHAAHRWFADVFPIVPWTGVFLVGTVLGGRMTMAMGTSGDPARLMLRAGLLALAGGAVMHGAHLASLQAGSHGWITLLHGPMCSLTSKLPPSAAYVCFYGGIGLLVLALLLQLERLQRGSAIIRLLEIVGRNSLFIFIVQYVLYFSVLVMIHPGPTVFWPLLFAASVVVLWGAAYASDRWRWNAALTVPLPAPKSSIHVP